MAQFYIICPLGLVEALENEVQEFWPYLIEANTRPHAESLQIINRELGGLLIEAPETLAYQINFFSKIASRVLERVAEFKVRDFPKLNSKLLKLDLKPWFGTQNFKLEVAASQSRLNNEKRIEQVFHSVFKIDEKSDFTLFVRMNQDMCSISVDTSGRHLHFRNPMNHEKRIGEAPIRETLAAFMIRALVEGVTLSEIQKTTLWDPMVGSGTLLSEAYTLHEPNLNREFTFQKFSKCPKILSHKIFKMEGLRSNYPQFPFGFAKYRGTDLDKKSLENLKHNLASLKNMEVSNLDFFASQKVEDKSEKLWIILNPPYNERLEFAEGFKRLGQTLSKSGALRVGVVAPVSQIKKIINEMSNYSILSQTKFKNGGIPVEYLVLQRSEVVSN